MPCNLLDYQFCTNKNLMGGESFEGITTYSQQRHPFACLALSVVCRVKLAVYVHHHLAWKRPLKSLCPTKSSGTTVIFHFFPGQEKNLLLLIPSHALVQLGETQDFVLSYMKSSETQIYFTRKCLIMGV